MMTGILPSTAPRPLPAALSTPCALSPSAAGILLEPRRRPERLPASLPAVAGRLPIVTEAACPVAGGGGCRSRERPGPAARWTGGQWTGGPADRLQEPGAARAQAPAPGPGS
ncbi:hypothetical protein GCM10009863_45470 [Streptomyces axinellae]|uniref:Uncharacterized protein n=1 Tax=Streptomyces axinellae TaxID=552788 RepID=A0ABP6CWZ2_9ACTN